VVLLHGYPEDSSAWSLVAPRLHDAGFRTLAPDQRGYSPGARPPGAASYAIGRLVDDVVALLDAAGVDRAHVVGHDWGGGVAWEIARRRPDRVRTLTVLSTPHPAAMAWAWRHSTQGLRSWYMVLFQIPVVAELLVHPGFVRTLVGTGLPEAAARRYAKAPVVAGPHRADLVVPGTQIRHGGSGALPRRIEVPTTYVWGRTTSPSARRPAQRTARYVSADYRFVALSAGHWLPEVNPSEVAAAILDRIRP
jgi:pimeloyl-ACP methyl ester carboxylesterase